MLALWHIDYYESPADGKPIEKFINSLEEKIQNKIVRVFELLQEFGIRTGPPHIKKLTGTEFWELRILGSDNIRFFYVA